MSLTSARVRQKGRARRGGQRGDPRAGGAMAPRQPCHPGVCHTSACPDIACPRKLQRKNVFNGSDSLTEQYSSCFQKSFIRISNRTHDVSAPMWNTLPLCGITALLSKYKEWFWQAASVAACACAGRRTGAGRQGGKHAFRQAWQGDMAGANTDHLQASRPAVQRSHPSLCCTCALSLK